MDPLISVTFALTITAPLSATELAATAAALKASLGMQPGLSAPSRVLFVAQYSDSRRLLTAAQPTSFSNTEASRGHRKAQSSGASNVPDDAYDEYAPPTASTSPSAPPSRTGFLGYKVVADFSISGSSSQASTNNLANIIQSGATSAIEGGDFYKVLANNPITSSLASGIQDSMSVDPDSPIAIVLPGTPSTSLSRTPSHTPTISASASPNIWTPAVVGVTAASGFVFLVVLAASIVMYQAWKFTVLGGGGKFLERYNWAKERVAPIVEAFVRYFCGCCILLRKRVKGDIVIPDSLVATLGLVPPPTREMPTVSGEKDVGDSPPPSSSGDSPSSSDDPFVEDVVNLSTRRLQIAPFGEEVQPKASQGLLSPQTPPSTSFPPRSALKLAVPSPSSPTSPLPMSQLSLADVAQGTAANEEPPALSYRSAELAQESVYSLMFRLVGLGGVAAPSGNLVDGGVRISSPQASSPSRAHIIKRFLPDYSEALLSPASHLPADEAAAEEPAAVEAYFPAQGDPLLSAPQPQPDAPPPPPPPVAPLPLVTRLGTISSRMKKKIIPGKGLRLRSPSLAGGEPPPFLHTTPKSTPRQAYLRAPPLHDQPPAFSLRAESDAPSRTTPQRLPVKLKAAGVELREKSARGHLLPGVPTSLLSARPARAGSPARSVASSSFSAAFGDAYSQGAESEEEDEEAVQNNARLSFSPAGIGGVMAIERVFYEGAKRAVAPGPQDGAAPASSSSTAKASPRLSSAARQLTLSLQQRSYAAGRGPRPLSPTRGGGGRGGGAEAGLASIGISPRASPLGAEEDEGYDSSASILSAPSDDALLNQPSMVEFAEKMFVVRGRQTKQQQQQQQQQVHPEALPPPGRRSRSPRAARAAPGHPRVTIAGLGAVVRKGNGLRNMPPAAAPSPALAPAAAAAAPPPAATLAPPSPRSIHIKIAQGHRAASPTARPLPPPPPPPGAVAFSPTSPTSPPVTGRVPSPPAPKLGLRSPGTLNKVARGLAALGSAPGVAPREEAFVLVPRILQRTPASALPLGLGGVASVANRWNAAGAAVLESRAAAVAKASKVLPELHAPETAMHSTTPPPSPSPPASFTRESPHSFLAMSVSSSFAASTSMETAPSASFDPLIYNRMGSRPELGNGSSAHPVRARLPVRLVSTDLQLPRPSIPFAVPSSSLQDSASAHSGGEEEWVVEAESLAEGGVSRSAVGGGILPEISEKRPWTRSVEAFRPQIL